MKKLRQAIQAVMETVTPKGRKNKAAMIAAKARQENFERIQRAYNGFVAVAKDGYATKDAFKASLWKEFGI